ncbi:hypothetical protein P3T76_004697 [Phytophthora citrophthora]|uniref:Uncharacterized protein n=1 Tax=Phytophthora citrophthora TaxID=4793 RepID=A0AAD9GRS9_9STRA|nr:hypothetical protein P3T76_004697 [Phytophthora citrophthora]
MLVCAGRTAQRRAQLRFKTDDWSSDEEQVPYGAIAQPRNRFDPVVVRSRNCSNIRKARRAARRRRFERQERRRRAEEWERAIVLARSSRLVARFTAEASALKLVSTYHDKLQHGYSEQLQVFLVSIIAEDIVTPELSGRNTFLKQWELFSRSHSQVDFRLDRLQLFPMEGAAKTYPSLAARDRDEAVYVVKSSGVNTLRISRLTLEQIFPHILTDEELVQYLIGKTYSFQFTVFSHVSADGKIFQMESRVDLASSLMALLQDRDTAVKMAREAVMLPSGNLTQLNEVREAQNVIANSYL